MFFLFILNLFYIYFSQAIF